MGRKNRGQPGLGRFAGIGVEFAGAVAGFTLVGYWLDRHYDWSPWGVVVGASLGLIGGMYNLIRESLAATRSAAREEGLDRASKASTPDDRR